MPRRKITLRLNNDVVERAKKCWHESELFSRSKTSGISGSFECKCRGGYLNSDLLVKNEEFNDIVE